MTITLKDFFQFLLDNKVLHPFMKYLKTTDDDVSCVRKGGIGSTKSL